MIQEKYIGKTAIVTGASRGIGRNIALTLAEEGMKVIASARNAKDIKDLSDYICDNGGLAEAVEVDLADESSVISLFQKVNQKYGSPGVLINNAGVGAYGPLAEYTTKDLDHLISVNLRGTYLCAREAMKCMIKERSGYIINIASVVGFKGYPNQSAYTATKHGVVGLTKSLAKEAQEYDIRVSVINPGGVDTKMVRKSRPDLNPSELLSPDDVSQAVIYLLSLSEKAAVDELYLRRYSSQPF